MMIRSVPRGCASMGLCLACLVLLGNLITIAATSEEQSCRAVYDGPPVCVSIKQPQCSLYMAPSTLGEGANLGMYTGKNIPNDEVIQKEIAIPLAFRTWSGPSYFHHWPELDKSGEKDDGALWYRYFWSGWVADLETFQENNVQGSKVVFVPGIGCTINSILDMRNVLSTHGSVYDTAGLPRGDPSAGAFCPYHSSVTKSIVEIPAGSEIFADYGDEWIPDIPGVQATLNKVMDRAEDFLRQDYLPFVQEHGTTLKQNVLEGLWNFTRDFPGSKEPTFSVLPRGVTWKEIHHTYTDVLSKKEAPILAEQEKSAQDDRSDVLDVLAQEPYYTETSSIIRYFIRQQGKRSLEWLEENGRCSDHLRPGNSTIPHAGRGAFATRDLPQGTIVGYSPLVRVGTYGMNLYNIPYKLGNDDAYNKSDLVLNYAFGHPNSTVLLSPYGSMVNYINHSPEPNVRVIWPTEEMMAHKPQWLERDIEVLTYTFDKIGLSFDYVALRDIKEGEEVTMDYGREWEQAWKDHVANWVPPKDAETYVHSTQWNETKLRTIKELSVNPYPPNLVTLCYPAYIWNPQRGRYLYMPLEREYNDRRPCNILDRREHVTDPDVHPEVYTVEIQTTGDPKVVLNFPRSAIYLTDRVMSQDWHLPNAFRHYIGIPDDIFPANWKNKLSEGGAAQESTNPEEEG